MNARGVALGVALAAAGALVCGGMTVTAFVGGDEPAEQVPVSVACGQPLPTAAVVDTVGGYTADQTRNAAVIVRVGQQMGVPPRGLIVAVATAMQESALRNLGHLGERNDHDSQGLFQQRPSQGWGTAAQVRDPQYAATKFYEKLLTVPGWAAMPVTAAAQRVQRSAFPSAYAKHEARAAHLVSALTGGGDRAGARLGACAAPGEVTAGGWTQPVPSPPGSGFRTRSRPTHQGVDLMADKGAPIKAAAAGTVSRMRCNAVHASTGAVWGCDRDGSPTLTRGCGWYVDLQHADGVITRYCHMLRRPTVSVGDRVTAGQVIGAVGSSGHSSGPHLHFEVHLRGDASSRGATDPVDYMRQRGAPLGGGRA